MRPYLPHGGKQRYLGLFAEELDAITAVRAARKAAAEGRFEEHKAARKAAAAAQRASGNVQATNPL